MCAFACLCVHLRACLCVLRCVFVCLMACLCVQCIVRVCLFVCLCLRGCACIQGEIGQWCDWLFVRELLLGCLSVYAIVLLRCCMGICLFVQL